MSFRHPLLDIIHEPPSAVMGLKILLARPASVGCEEPPGYLTLLENSLSIKVIADRRSRATDLLKRSATTDDIKCVIAFLKELDMLIEHRCYPNILKKFLSKAHELEIKHNGSLVKGLADLGAVWREELDERLCEQMWMITHGQWDANYKAGTDPVQQLADEVMETFKLRLLQVPAHKSRRNSCSIRAVVKRVIREKFVKPVLKASHGVKTTITHSRNVGGNGQKIPNRRRKLGRYCFEQHIVGWDCQKHLAFQMERSKVNNTEGKKNMIFRVLYYFHFASPVLTQLNISHHCSPFLPPSIHSIHWMNNPNIWQTSSVIPTEDAVLYSVS